MNLLCVVFEDLGEFVLKIWAKKSFSYDCLVTKRKPNKFSTPSGCSGKKKLKIKNYFNKIEKTNKKNLLEGYLKR